MVFHIFYVKVLRVQAHQKLGYVQMAAQIRLFGKSDQEVTGQLLGIMGPLKEYQRGPLYPIHYHFLTAVYYDGNCMCSCPKLLCGAVA